MGGVDDSIGHSIQSDEVDSSWLNRTKMVGSSHTSVGFSTMLFGGWCSLPLQLSGAQSQPTFSSNIFAQTHCAAGCREIDDTKPALQASNFLSSCDFHSQCLAKQKGRFAILMWPAPAGEVAMACVKRLTSNGSVVPRWHSTQQVWLRSSKHFLQFFRHLSCWRGGSCKT